MPKSPPHYGNSKAYAKHKKEVMELAGKALFMFGNKQRAVGEAGGWALVLVLREIGRQKSAGDAQTRT